jgi:hypothetical protein
MLNSQMTYISFLFLEEDYRWAVRNNTTEVSMNLVMLQTVLNQNLS